MKDRSCTHSRSSRRCSIIMQINASRCHPKLTADHYETARGEKQNFLSRLIEQNNKDVLHLCFIGCFLRKMRLGYNSNSFVVNIMIDKLNETVWRLNFGHINVTMTRSRETHPFSWKVKESTWKTQSCSRLRLEQLLRFSRALQTSRAHP